MALTSPHLFFQSPNFLNKFSLFSPEYKSGKTLPSFSDLSLNQDSFEDIQINKDLGKCLPMDNQKNAQSNNNNNDRYEKEVKNKNILGEQQINRSNERKIQNLILLKILKKSTSQKYPSNSLTEKHSLTRTDLNKVQNRIFHDQFLSGEEKGSKPMFISNTTSSHRQNYIQLPSKMKDQQFFIDEGFKPLQEKIQNQKPLNQSNHSPKQLKIQEIDFFIATEQGNKKKTQSQSPSSSFITLLSRIQEGVEQNFQQKHAIQKNQIEKNIIKCNEVSSPKQNFPIHVRQLSQLAQNENQSVKYKNKEISLTQLKKLSDDQLPKGQEKFNNPLKQFFEQKYEQITSNNIHENQFLSQKNSTKFNQLAKTYFQQSYEYNNYASFIKQQKNLKSSHSLSKSKHSQCHNKKRKSFFKSTQFNVREQEDNPSSKDKTGFWVPKNQFQFHYKDKNLLKIVKDPNSLDSLKEEKKNKEPFGTIRKRSSGICISYFNNIEKNA